MQVKVQHKLNSISMTQALKNTNIQQIQQGCDKDATKKKKIRVLNKVREVIRCADYKQKPCVTKAADF